MSIGWLRLRASEHGGDYVTDIERASLARGFLFADLRGYSAFVERHGDQAGADLIRTYRDLVRAAVAAFRGAEIRTETASTSPSTRRVRPCAAGLRS